MSKADWIVVDTTGPEPLVVVQGSRPRDWRRLRNVLRGDEFKNLSALAEESVTERSTATRRFDCPVRRRPVDAIAIPALSPSGEVHAVALGFEGDSVSPRMGAFEWEHVRDAPPRLWLSTEAMDILGMDERFRDRATYGPADLFTRVIQLADVAAILRSIDPDTDGVEVGDLQVDVRGDDGAMTRIHYVYRRVDQPTGLRIRGVMVDITASADGVEMATSVLDAEVAQVAISHLGVHGAVVDMRYAGFPYVVKWLTVHPEGMGHGVSTGQTPGIHGDDMEAAAQLYRDAINGKTTNARLRIRRAGGGWLSLDTSAALINPVTCPNLLLVTMRAPGVAAQEVEVFPPITDIAPDELTPSG